MCTGARGDVLPERTDDRRPAPAPSPTPVSHHRAARRGAWSLLSKVISPVVRPGELARSGGSALYYIRFARCRHGHADWIGDQERAKVVTVRRPSARVRRTPPRAPVWGPGRSRTGLPPRPRPLVCSALGWSSRRPTGIRLARGASANVRICHSAGAQHSAGRPGLPRRPHSPIDPDGMQRQRTRSARPWTPRESRSDFRHTTRPARIASAR